MWPDTAAPPCLDNFGIVPFCPWERSAISNVLGKVLGKIRGWKSLANVLGTASWHNFVQCDV